MKFFVIQKFTIANPCDHNGTYIIVNVISSLQHLMYNLQTSNVLSDRI